MTERGTILELCSVTKSFRTFNAVDGIDLESREGEFFTIVGPSGSGKTTLLRMLAGLERPTPGDILIRGESVNDVPANRRPTCLVFQSLALFPHKSVGDNIEFSLKIRGVAAETRKRKALELMAAPPPARSTITRRASRNAPAASGSAWRSPGRSPSTRRSCSSTSRFRRSTTSSARRSRRS